jgi:aminotransferase
MARGAEKSWRSERVSWLQQSEIRAMTRECQRVGGINLGQGICDLPTPPEVLEPTAQAVLADKSVYSKFEGIDDLREQVARKAREFNGISEASADGNVVVTIGSTGAWASAVQALFNPGDEIILFEPFYGYHLNTLKVGGCVPKFVGLSAPGWEVRREDLEAACGPRTRALLFSNPTNPSGKVFTRAELEVIAAFCIERDLIAITDEIYEYIVYSGATHTSLASLPGMWERTITMSGYSKTFSITGWRLGTVVAPAHLAEPIGLVNDLFYVCAPTPLQHGVAAGIAALDASYYQEMSADYERKRDHFCGALERAGLTPHVPGGAYYVLADVSGLGEPTAKAAAMRILEEVGVASVPGSAFFASDAGESLTRFCYAKDWDVLREASERIERLGRGGA